MGSPRVDSSQSNTARTWGLSTAKIRLSNLKKRWDEEGEGGREGGREGRREG